MPGAAHNTFPSPAPQWSRVQPRLTSEALVWHLPGYQGAGNHRAALFFSLHLSALTLGPVDQS